MKLVRWVVALSVVGAGSVFVAQGVRPFVPYARAATASKKVGIEISDDRLNEISGCAVSSVNPGVVWVHNDSGDDAVIYALRAADGATLGVVDLKGVKARDFEDMAVSNDRLFVGDIGDNRGSRKSINVHSVAEPKVDLDLVKQRWKLKPKTSVLKYPEKARDAEAMLVDPDGAIMIIDKQDGTVWRADATGTLGSVASLNMPLITGASMVPGKREVLVRTYPVVLRYAVKGTGSFDAVWSAKSSIVVSPLLPQAEAVCAAPGGSTGFTISESGGVRARLIPIKWG
jgi:hypothetical protein